jgi:Nucleotidyltransferase of unknown function (DUF6036)
VKRSELAHILRAASDVTDDPAILVIGSQAVLASFDETELPEEAIRSIEADVAFLEDPDERKSDAVDGAIGEESRFHETFGVYGQGVSIRTATLPVGWQERLVAFDDPEAGTSKAVCLEAHDIVISKLVAGRDKDFEFARALLVAGLIHVDVLLARAQMLPGPGAIRSRVIRSIRQVASRP